MRADWVTGFVGALVVALTVLYVRTAFGVVFGVLFGMGMVLVSQRGTRSLNRTLLLALGLTSVLYAILDIKSDILDRPGVESDAYILAELTGVPTLVWGVAWISVALAFSFWLLHRAYKEA